jgi:hypothetical protein
MRSHVALAAAWLAFATSASAQTDTADGAAALARGDYLQAAAILQPIAEDWRRTDPVARFFMATLYETGRGVPLDLVRACALYQGAAADLDAPLGAQAMRQLRALVLSHDADWNEDCQLLAQIGFDHGFEPVTFTLGAGHEVAWDLKGATITNGATVKRFPMRLASMGSVFLPLRQTDLPPGPPQASARHFVEIFLWRPSSDGRSWALQWHLFEVTRDSLIRVEVGAEPLDTVEAALPPGPRFFDPRAYVDLRVNVSGEAEWVRLRGRRIRR